MRTSSPEIYRDPRTQLPLELQTDSAQADVKTGRLASASEVYEIIRGIPRFCPAENYAANFGYQWKRYATTQLDSQTSFKNISTARLFETTGWPRAMPGERILEAGSGMGRFTEVLARTGAEICTFDYSTAVEVNKENNGHFENVHFAQGDIYHPPYEPGSFDKVLCLGVLQHCPSPRDAFLSLVRFLKPGGEICIDNYALDWRTPFLGKYYIRWITRRISPAALHRFVRWHVGWVFPLTARLYRVIGRPAGVLSWMLAVASYRRLVTADEATLKELAMLDTFDMLSPAHDQPRNVRMVRGWCRLAGLEDCHVFHNGASLVIARGRRPRDA